LKWAKEADSFCTFCNREIFPYSDHEFPAIRVQISQQKLQKPSNSPSIGFGTATQGKPEIKSGLTAEQVNFWATQFEAQMQALSPFFEEGALLQRYLIRREWREEIDQTILSLFPVEATALEQYRLSALRANPAIHGSDALAALESIADVSLIGLHRVLARLALWKNGRLESLLLEPVLAASFDVVAMGNPNRPLPQVREPLARELALSLCHWALFLPAGRSAALVTQHSKMKGALDLGRLARATAILLEEERETSIRAAIAQRLAFTAGLAEPSAQVDALLEEGLRSDDLDLRLTCHLAMERDPAEILTLAEYRAEPRFAAIATYLLPNSSQWAQALSGPHPEDAWRVLAQRIQAQGLTDGSLRELLASIQPLLELPTTASPKTLKLREAILSALLSSKSLHEIDRESLVSLGTELSRLPGAAILPHLRTWIGNPHLPLEKPHIESLFASGLKIEQFLAYSDPTLGADRAVSGDLLEALVEHLTTESEGPLIGMLVRILRGRFAEPTAYGLLVSLGLGLTPRPPALSLRRRALAALTMLNREIKPPTPIVLFRLEPISHQAYVSDPAVALRIWTELFSAPDLLASFEAREFLSRFFVAEVAQQPNTYDWLARGDGAGFNRFIEALLACAEKKESPSPAPEAALTVLVGALRQESLPADFRMAGLTRLEAALSQASRLKPNLSYAISRIRGVN
jgi:hypothetical protein